MQNKLVTFLFYICSFSPVFFIYGSVKFIQHFTIAEKMTIISSGDYGSLLLVALLCLGIPFVSILIVDYLLKKRLEKVHRGKKIEISTFEPIDGKSTSLLLVSSFALLTVDVWTFAIVIGLIGVFSIKNNQIEPSPILVILGWHFYKVVNKEGITYTLISIETLDPQKHCPVLCNLATMTPYLRLHSDEKEICENVDGSGEKRKEAESSEPKS